MSDDVRPSTGRRGVGQDCPRRCHFLLRRYCPTLHRASCHVSCGVHGCDSIRRVGHVVTRRPRGLDLGRFCLITEVCRPNALRFASIFRATMHVFPRSRVTGLGTTGTTVHQNGRSTTHGCLTGTNGSTRTICTQNSLTVHRGSCGVTMLRLRGTHRVKLRVTRVALTRLAGEKCAR